MNRRAWLVSLALIVPSAAQAHSFQDPIFVPDPAATAGDNFGLYMIPAGNYLLVGAPATGIGVPGNGQTRQPKPGVVYLIDPRDGSIARVFNEPAFNGTGPLPTDSFGDALASDGNRVVISAPAANGGVGVVFVFDLPSGKLMNAFTEPGGGCPGDNFGAVSLVLAGNTLFASAWGWAAPDSSCNPSASYEGRAWNLDLRTGEASVTYNSPTQALDQFFGWGLMTSGDDLVVTATQFPLGSFFPGGPGVAYIMEAMSGKLEATIPDPDGVVGDGFGDSFPVPVGNGFAIPAQTALVKDSAGNEVQGGAAHLFDSRGHYRLTVRDPQAAGGDYFGNALGYSTNGFLVSAPGGGPAIGWPMETPPGHAYVYSSAGHLMHTFQSPDPQPDDGFGEAVAQIGGDVAATSMLMNGGEGGLWIFHQHDACDDEECRCN